MPTQPTRVVDAHVHIWDPARTDWYPYLSRPPEGGSGDASRMYRRFDIDTYRAEAAKWNVEKFVNVAAATGRNSIEETIELDSRAETGGGPDAIIGGLPPTDTVAEAIDLLDRQMAASRFRGVRPMGIHTGPVPNPGVLSALQERNLVFELMTHPDQLRVAAAQLAGLDDLTVVVEHTGWPRSGSDEERALWRDGLGALADLGDNVVCKLSGLAMPFGSMGVDALAPWLEYAIEVFGVDRCMFASNFPVDSMYGTFDELYTTFSTVTGGLDSVTATSSSPTTPSGSFASDSAAGHTRLNTAATVTWLMNRAPSLDHMSPHWVRSISTSPVTSTRSGPASVTTTGTSSGRLTPCTVSVPLTISWLPVTGRAPVTV